MLSTDMSPVKLVPFIPMKRTCVVPLGRVTVPLERHASLWVRCCCPALLHTVRHELPTSACTDSVRVVAPCMCA